MATYSVFVPAPKGHTGELPVIINGTEKDGSAVHHSVKIPYDTEVTGVPEAVAKYVEKNHGAKITAEPETAPATKKGKGKGKATDVAEPEVGAEGN